MTQGKRVNNLVSFVLSGVDGVRDVEKFSINFRSNMSNFLGKGVAKAAPFLLGYLKS